MMHGIHKAKKEERWICCFFYSKTNQMHQCIKFILFWNDTPHVSVHHQEFKTVHTATKQMPVAVCTVLNAWWLTERPSKTCRVSFQNKINWYSGASGWFYYRKNILRCTALWMSNEFAAYSMSWTVLWQIFLSKVSKNVLIESQK